MRSAVSKILRLVHRSVVMHHALRPVAVAVLASVLMTAVVSVPAGVSAGSGGVAQASTTTTTQPATGPTRVECDAAEGDLVPLCQAYDHITTNYVDTLTEQQLASLASRAAAYVRNAGLTARTDGMPPPCPLPTADFEQVCVQIDAVDDTAAAVWEAIKGMVKILDSNSSLWTNETYERFMEWVDNKQTGIGIGLALMAGDVACEEVSSTCRPVIIDVYPGSPAETGGLMEGTSSWN